jgi:hypothetical protein
LPTHRSPQPNTHHQPALRASLSTHQLEAQRHFDDLHASQKRLTANLRSLLNALDALLRLAAPRPDPAAVEQLRAVVGGARALQARLRGVGTRLDRVEAVLADVRGRQAGMASWGGGKAS